MCSRETMQEINERAVRAVALASDMLAGYTQCLPPGERSRMEKRIQSVMWQVAVTARTIENDTSIANL